jgi:uncharacterized protein (DUF305 family)
MARTRTEEKMTGMRRTAAVLATAIVLAGFGCAPKAPPYDLRYIDTITANYNATLALAQAAETTASHPELADFAREVIEVETEEAAQFSKWREEWYRTRPAAIDSQLTGTQVPVTAADLSQLTLLTGTDLDLKLIDLMTPYHQGAVALALQAETNAKHAEIRTMAAEILDFQQRHVELLKQMADGWNTPQ